MDRRQTDGGNRRTHETVAAVGVTASLTCCIRPTQVNIMYVIGSGHSFAEYLFRVWSRKRTLVRASASFIPGGYMRTGVLAGVHKFPSEFLKDGGSTGTQTEPNRHTYGIHTKTAHVAYPARIRNLDVT